MTIPSGISLGSPTREPCEPLPLAIGVPANEMPAPSERKGEDPAVVNAKIEAQLKRDTETFKREESRVLKLLLLGQAGSGACSPYAKCCPSWCYVHTLDPNQESLRR